MRLLRWGTVWPVLIFAAITAGELVRWQPISGSAGAASVLDFALVACVGGFLFEILRKRRLKEFVSETWRHPVWKWSVWFLAWALLSLLINTILVPYAPKEFVTAFAYFGRLALVFGLLWLASFRRDKRSPATEVFLGAGSLLVLFGFLQLIFVPNFEFMKAHGWDPHVNRLLSTFYDPNYLGVFLVLVMVVALAYVFKKAGRARVLSILLFIASWAALYLTFSRSAWVAGFIAVPAMAFKRDWRLALLIAAVFVGALFLPGRLGQRFQSSQNLANQQNYDFAHSQVKCDPYAPNAHCENSGAARVITFQKGLKLVAKDPVLGVGYNAYGYAQVHHKVINTLLTEVHSAQGSDSSLLNILATTGIVGLGLFLAFLATVMRRLFSLARGGDWLASGLLWFTVAWIPASFFNNSLLYLPILVPWGILVSLVLVDRKVAR